MRLAWLPEDPVRNLVEVQGLTHSDALVQLRTLYPGCRGLSLRNFKEYCREHGIIKRFVIADNSLRQVVSLAVSNVSLCLIFSCS